MVHILLRIIEVQQQFDQPASRNIGPYHDCASRAEPCPAGIFAPPELAEKPGIDGEDESASQRWRTRPALFILSIHI